MRCSPFRLPVYRTRHAFLVLALLLTPSSLPAQTITPVFKAGVSAATLRGASAFDFRTSTGFAGGVGFNYALRGGWSLQPEVLYVVKGTTMDFDVRSSADTIFILPPGRDDTATPATGGLELTYVELPLLVLRRFEMRGRLHPALMAGPAAAFLLDARFRWQPRGGGLEQEQSEDNVEGLDFGLVVGGGVEYELGGPRLSLSARASIGLTNINFANAREEDQAFYNTSVIFLAGLVF
ncbi:MAG: hypothetical protein KatS3mg044_1101 [Rhodothermaceae bacterium]|nr:MAG: hypothetical protein KatS3mg044_1101 [Rhodothermaceae bacterium]